MARVRVKVSYSELGGDDPVEVIRRKAIYELKVSHGYDEEEITTVEDDEVLKESCRQAYQAIRDAAWRNAKNGNAETRREFRLAYSRPESRGFLDREAWREES